MTATRQAEARVLARALAGNEDAFRELTSPYRRELQLHCYRILGSVQDAEDLLQETLLAAWRSLDAFESRASVRAWLDRIATNRCLNALRARAPTTGAASHGCPCTHTPDRADMARALPPTRCSRTSRTAPRPAARYESRETIELAFIVALQGLPPSQRVAVVLRDVLGFRTAEVADMLDTSEVSVKGALQRARATLEEGLPARDRTPRPSSARERQLVGCFADAVESGEVDDIVALLTDDALLTMPPQPLEYQGHDAVGAFLRHRAELRGAAACGADAGQYPAGVRLLPPDPQAAIARPYGLIVLTLEGEAVAGITWFADTGVFRHFGLPRALPNP